MPFVGSGDSALGPRIVGDVASKTEPAEFLRRGLGRFAVDVEQSDFCPGGARAAPVARPRPEAPPLISAA